MIGSTRSEVTEILHALQGDETDRRQYSDQLFEHVYNELHRVAVDLMRLERIDHTLQPTAVVHEAYLQLVDQTRTDWKDRAHFFRTAARAMRRILIDHARQRLADKRGGGRAILTLDENLAGGEDKEIDVLEFDEVLTDLAKMDQRMARVVEFRVFAGMTNVETALVLGVSERTVREDWRMAKMWLRHELSGNATQ